MRVLSTWAGLGLKSGLGEGVPIKQIGGLASCLHPSWTQFALMVSSASKCGLDVHGFRITVRVRVRVMVRFGGRV